MWQWKPGPRSWASARAAIPFLTSYSTVILKRRQRGRLWIGKLGRQMEWRFHEIPLSRSRVIGPCGFALEGKKTWPTAILLRGPWLSPATIGLKPGFEQNGLPPIKGSAFGFLM